MKNALWKKGFSVRYKLFGLVLIPIALSLTLLGHQIVSLSAHMSDLEKANTYARYLKEVSALFQQSYTIKSERALSHFRKNAEQTQQLHPQVFGNGASEQTSLIIELIEATDAYKSAIDDEEKLEIREWQGDVYKQLLLALEKVPFEHANTDVIQHLQALTQIEWLRFWSSEETERIKSLIKTVRLNSSSSSELSDQIQVYGQRQQLLVERFVSLNANQQQVDLMVETFGDEAFSKSHEFRVALLDPATAQVMTFSEITSGMQSLISRLQSLNSLNETIEMQLLSTIKQYSDDTQQKIIWFIALLLLVAISITALAMKLANRVTKQLNVVLKFLRHQDEQNEFEHVTQSRDELGEFAQEVERLTYEREQANQKLIVAKNVAEEAKEAAIQSSKAKSSFLANMSHEIRTPLNGVIGISEVLSDTSLTATQRDYVDTIETSSQLLLSLINDILDFSKIESGMLIISSHSTNIRESVYDIAAIVAPKAKEKNIELKVSVSQETPFRAMVDDHRLRQVVMNLASNAVKFTDTGSVEIGVHVQAMYDKQLAVQFSVKDTGIGIDEKQKAKIFEPFAQEDNSTTRQFGGTGLGLAISTQLIELMGGEIQLDSVKGEGSTFYFTLELPIERHDYQAISTETERNVIVVCSDKRTKYHLVEELKFYHVEILQVLDNLEELDMGIARNKQAVVVYAEGEANEGTHRIQQISALEEKNISVCLVRHFCSSNHDFGNQVSAIITAPIFGQRLLKAIDISLEKQVRKVTNSEQFVEVSSNNRILIVEDNKVNQKIASLHVKKSGFEFDIANNGLEAVEMYLRNSKYALILMDCMMPIMDGFKATERIREIESEHPERGHIPIIALTASVIDDDVQRCFDMGMDDYVPKPFKNDVLKEKIVNAIGNSITPISQVLQTNVGANTTETREDDAQNLSTSITNEGGSTPAKDTARTVTAPSSEQLTSTTRKNVERVLLVEDNRVNQKVASLHLKKAGYDFEIAENGQIAVEKYSEDSSNFDIILMDCMMPIKDGFEATQDIRKFERTQGIKKTPIIALTASVIDDDIQRCYDSGMDAYVPKPVNRDVLLHQIENVS